MITIEAMNDGRVIRIDYAAQSLHPGAVEVPEVPDMPEVPKGKRPELRLDAEVPQLYWELVDAHDEPAPAPEEPPAPTHEEVEASRAAAYRATVDHITCEIARLRDMGGTEDEIAEAEARREAAVAAIKAQYPYPEEEVSMADSSQI